VKTGTGSTDTAGAAGGFTYFNTVSATIVCSAAVAAGSPLTVASWTAGASGNGMTQLSSQMTIIVDLGLTASPTGSGLYLVALGVGSYAGSVTITLP
jgi:hypothetical protein